MNNPNYTYSDSLNAILKDGHTMFLQDAVKDLRYYLDAFLKTQAHISELEKLAAITDDDVTKYISEISVSGCKVYPKPEGNFITLTDHIALTAKREAKIRELEGKIKGLLCCQNCGSQQDVLHQPCSDGDRQMEICLKNEHGNWQPKEGK